MDEVRRKMLGGRVYEVGLDRTIDNRLKIDR